MSALETLKSGQFSIQNKLHYRTTINKTNIFRASLALTITQYQFRSRPVLKFHITVRNFPSPYAL